MKALCILTMSAGVLLATSPLASSETIKRDLEPQQLAASDTDFTVLSYHMGLMTRKIRMNLNPVLCPISNPEVALEIRLTENGDLSDVPKFITRSNSFDCDDAVVRAIYAAKPFAMPHNHPKELKMMMEPMLLKFKPRS